VKEEVVAELHAIDWLLKNYATATDDAISRILFEGVREMIEALPEFERSAIFFSLHEWLIAEGEYHIDEPPVRVRDLLLGPDGPLLTAIGRRHIEDLAASTISLYEVIEVRKGEGILVRDMLRADEAPVFVHDEDAPVLLSPLDTVGIRILRREDDFRMGSGIFPFEPFIARRIVDTALETLGQGIDEEDYAPYTVDELISATIISSWLKINAMIHSRPAIRRH
jgi:hypothetical protein